MVSETATVGCFSFSCVVAEKIDGLEWFPDAGSSLAGGLLLAADAGDDDDEDDRLWFAARDFH